MIQFGDFCPECGSGEIDPVLGHRGDTGPGEVAAMAAEIAYLNDEWMSRSETPEERWVRMRAWVDEQIVPYEDE